MTAIVLDLAGGGSRDVVRTTDSVARQSPAGGIALATVTDLPVFPSLTARLGIRIHRARNRAGAINTAVDASSSEVVLIMGVPWLAGTEMAARCAALLLDTRDDALVVPTLELRTADGLTRRTLDCAPGLTPLLLNPVATPPVFAVRRSTWETLGGFDECLGELAGCDWWLRVLARGWPIVQAPEACALLEGGERFWWPPIPGQLDVTAYRAVLEKHRPLLETKMSDLVVGLEMAGGALIRDHRREVIRRDRTLADLDRLRADAAHHRAYIEHHADVSIDWGDLRRADPVSREWGYDRGIPVDRRYIEDFLASRSSDIGGAVLEVQEDDFTRRFGGERVRHSDVVDLDDSNPRATIVADLRAAVGLPDGKFDCIILTQTLHVIDAAMAVVQECFRLLKPAGVLLVTLPSASRVCLEYGDSGDLWRVTPAGAKALFDPVFGAENVDVSTYGSVLTNVAFLHGLACSEVTNEEFEANDPYHPLVVGVRAQKAPQGAARSRGRSRTGVVLLYHRVADVSDVHDLSVPPALFEEQLQWLARECHVLPLDELLCGARDGLPERAVAITFDDGYLDTLHTAAPILERFGMPATVFPTTRWLETPGEYWWDVLERALCSGETPPQLVFEDGLVFATGTVAERRAAHDTLHDRLVHAALSERDRRIAELERWAALKPDRCRRPIVADELRQLSTVPGLSIGAHTVNHLALPDQDAPTQRTEVLESMQSLERVLGRRVDCFAHPYGAVDRTTAHLVRGHCRWSAGCRSAAIGASFDAAAFPRLEVKRWDAAAISSIIGSVSDRSFFSLPARLS